MAVKKDLVFVGLRGGIYFLGSLFGGGLAEYFLEVVFNELQNIL